MFCKLGLLLTSQNSSDIEVVFCSLLVKFHVASNLMLLEGEKIISCCLSSFKNSSTHSLENGTTTYTYVRGEGGWNFSNGTCHFPILLNLPARRHNIPAQPPQYKMVLPCISVMRQKKDFLAFASNVLNWVSSWILTKANQKFGFNQIILNIS